jgi:hypothetical protein
MPVSPMFENFEVGASIVGEIVVRYDAAREQIQAVLEFGARSPDAPLAVRGNAADAHPL